eukprot:213843-Pleurochrysis_carterae.AAC.1
MATAPAQATETVTAQRVEAMRVGSATSTPGSNMVRCTPTTSAAVTRATFNIREARAHPATGRGWRGELSSMGDGVRAAGFSFPRSVGDSTFA